MFLLKDEIPHAARSFAPKFADIRRRRAILFGDDSFASLTIPRDAEIRQLRQQLLNLILRLRAAYVARSLREEQLSLLIAGALGPLRSYAAVLLDLEGRPAPRFASPAIVGRRTGHSPIGRNSPLASPPRRNSRLRSR